VVPARVPGRRCGRSNARAATAGLSGSHPSATHFDLEPGGDVDVGTSPNARIDRGARRRSFTADDPGPRVLDRVTKMGRMSALWSRIVAIVKAVAAAVAGAVSALLRRIGLITASTQTSLVAAEGGRWDPVFELPNVAITRTSSPTGRCCSGAAATIRAAR
jgi:hypothetical protein